MRKMKKRMICAVLSLLMIITALPVYYAARYLTKDKTPRMNTAMKNGRWLPADWDVAMDYIDAYDNNQALIRGKSGTFKVYNSHAGARRIAVYL